MRCRTQKYAVMLRSHDHVYMTLLAHVLSNNHESISSFIHLCLFVYLYCKCYQNLFISCSISILGCRSLDRAIPHHTSHSMYKGPAPPVASEKSVYQFTQDRHVQAQGESVSFNTSTTIQKSLAGVLSVCDIFTNLDLSRSSIISPIPD